MGEVCAEIEPIGGVRVRPWRTADAEVLVDAWHDPEIGRWNPVPADRTLDFATTWIGATSTQTIASTGIDVVIVDMADHVLGEIGLQVDRSQQIAELGFWIASAHRGRGHGRSLLQLSIELAERLELVGLVAITDARSTRRAFARRVAA
jgi:RimJ/RimL family protein N-acetyltransferase